MPKVVREDVDNLNTVLTVTIDKSEYEDQFNAELNKYRKQVQIKGFRKGKTPVSVLRKMYGKAVLSEVINNLLQQEMGQYLTDNNLNYLGQPLPNDEQQVYSFDPRELDDFEFKFDLGLAPDFEVQGLGDDAAFDKYDVSIPAEKIENELTAARKRMGKQVSVSGELKDGDLIKLSIRELDGDSPREGGLENEFSVPADRLTETAEGLISSHQPGETFHINIYDLEKDTSRKYVQNYFLKATDESAAEAIGEMVQASVVEITRLQEAEMDEEFFNQMFGEGVVAGEEEAREKMAKDLKFYYDRQAEAIMFRAIQEYLLEKNAMELPNGFLRRWLKTNNEKLTDAQIDSEFPDFLENLQWTLIRSKLARSYDVQVTQAEVVAGFKDQVRRMISNPALLGDSFLESMARRMMEKEEDVDRMAQQILTDKIFAAVRDAVKINLKAVTIEELEQAILDINQADQAKNMARQASIGASGEEE